MDRDYIDMSTARGIQKYIQQRILELSSPHADSVAMIEMHELKKLDKLIDAGIDQMIEDMHRESQERARQQEIRLEDAGVSVDELKAEAF